VIITPYRAEWREMFRQLGSDLRSALGDIALRIDHIGSTSVPGLVLLFVNTVTYGYLDTVSYCLV
jgi:GrpB-like predicted nucleotidyltransferase (UPF0157 family)